MTTRGPSCSLLSFPQGIRCLLFYDPAMPQRKYDFFVYVLASRSRQLYVGMTNSLERRMKEHRAALPGSYTTRYGINRLVYFEHTSYVLNAIARETEWKGWTREQKVELIESVNPTWQDLSVDWGESVRVFWREVEQAKARTTADSLRE